MCLWAAHAGATHRATWGWHLAWQSRGVGREHKGGLHPEEVDLGLTEARSGDKAPIDSFHALVWVLFAEYLQH